jgi:membrane protein DedA with SNARE-associated domain
MSDGLRFATVAPKRLWEGVALPPRCLVGTFFAIFGVVLSTLVLPLPEELALLWAGWMAHGNIPMWAAFLAAFAGVMIGDTVSFLIGRALLPKLLSTHLGRRIVKPDLRKWAEDFVQKYGAWAVVLARFLVGLRGPVYLAIGAAKYPASRFYLINALVGAIEIAIVVTMGYWFGASKDLAHDVKWISLVVGVVLGMTMLIPVLIKRRLSRMQAGAARA